MHTNGLNQEGDNSTNNNSLIFIMHYSSLYQTCDSADQTRLHDTEADSQDHSSSFLYYRDKSWYVVSEFRLHSLAVIFIGSYGV